PLDVNVWELSESERRRHAVQSLPANLGEAIGELERSELMREALGGHVFDNFVAAKKREWSDYISQVTEWEIGKYLTTY
ncbi:MAG: hypothetical protein ACODAA_09980, partial [Gemmatimonadota bacterium]